MSSFLKKKKKKRILAYPYFSEILRFNNGLKKKCKCGMLNFLTYIKIQNKCDFS
jgi:hypothetical protein